MISYLKMYIYEEDEKGDCW